jgi:hypothetical protein
MRVAVVEKQGRISMMRRETGWKGARPLLLALLLSTYALAQARDGDAAIVHDFQQRLNNYLSLRKQQNIPNKSSTSADKLADQKQQATEKVQAARRAAQRGDIFTPSIAAYFKRQIASTMHGPAGAKIRASMRHAEPLPNVHLEVNAKYPKNLPYQSTPPTLLMTLPPLPKELQYRVVGSTLVLYDVASNVIVDLIPGAIV